MHGLELWVCSPQVREAYTIPRSGDEETYQFPSPIITPAVPSAHRRQTEDSLLTS